MPAPPPGETPSPLEGRAGHPGNPPLDRPQRPPLHHRTDHVPDQSGCRRRRTPGGERRDCLLT